MNAGVDFARIKPSIHSNFPGETMQNTQPVGPVGRDFESLVELLPPWALQHEWITIEKVRKALVTHESTNGKNGNTAENLHAARNVV